MSKQFFEKKKRSTQKVMKVTLRLLSSKCEKSFTQPFIRYHSHSLPLSGTGNFPASRGLSRRSKKRGWRDLCRLLTCFLSRMRWRFLNNQRRLSPLRHNRQNRFAGETLVETRVCCRPSKFNRFTRV